MIQRFDRNGIAIMKIPREPLFKNGVRQKSKKMDPKIKFTVTWLDKVQAKNNNAE